MLTRGNKKLGENTFGWSIPASTTCPGRSKVCESVCYGLSGRYRFGFVRKRLEENLRLSQQTDFVDNMIREVKRRWVQVCRVHVVGDFMDPIYTDKWLQVFRACQRTRFYWYSRSWRVPEIRPVLEEMAMLRNVRCWWSADRDTGVPERVPPGVRVAWLQDRSEDEVEVVDLLFVARRLRREAVKLALPMLCPNEANKALDCGECAKCWK